MAQTALTFDSNLEPMGQQTVVFDGECGLCNRLITRLIAADTHGVFKICGSDSDVGRALIQRAKLDSNITQHTVVVVDGEQSWTYSSAVLHVLTQLPLPWALLGILSVVPRGIRDKAYRLIAKHRKDLFGADPSCGVPSQSVRDLWMSRLATSDPEPVRIFEFEISRSLRFPALLFGVRRATAYVHVTEHLLVVRYGLAWVETSLDNVRCAKITGPYRWAKIAGVRESWVDHGLSFCGSTKGGVCICFHEKVSGLGRRKRHPGLTITVKNPEELISLLDPLIKRE